MEAWTGVIGIVVGAILGWLAKWWQTKLEWEREDQRRWLEDRRRLYSEMIEAIKDMRVFLGTVEFIRREIPVPEGSRVPNSDELDTMFNHALNQVEKARRDISLIASDKVVKQSEELWRLCAMCHVGRAQHPDLLDELEVAQGDFTQAVREELGVSPSAPK